MTIRDDVCFDHLESTLRLLSEIGKLIYVPNNVINLSPAESKIQFQPKPWAGFGQHHRNDIAAMSAS